MQVSVVGKEWRDMRNMNNEAKNPARRNGVLEYSSGGWEERGKIILTANHANHANEFPQKRPVWFLGGRTGPNRSLKCG